MLLNAKTINYSECISLSYPAVGRNFLDCDEWWFWRSSGWVMDVHSWVIRFCGGASLCLKEALNKAEIPGITGFRPAPE